ncbi:ABC transporter substrate-binding protein [Microbacterium sp.]|uniref:ABC transporter substrate-binding protein n=1 Tax=Microbacterium sp. TaxID=51671 RepID=UPI003F952D1A
MASSRSRLTLIAAAFAVIGLTLAACSGGGSTNSENSSDPLPDDQQVLTFVPNYGIQSLDISQAPLEIGMNQVLSNVMQPLVRVDGEDIVPVLATEWEWTEPTSLKISLRDGVTFSDGKAFTANDVVGTLDRYIAQEQSLAASLAVIDGYEAVDDSTIVINTASPTGTLVGILSMVYIGQAEHSTDDEWWAQPVGTGAFVIDDYVADDHVTLVRHEDYWGEKALLNTLTFKIVPDINAKMTGLSNDEIQVVNGVPFDQIEAVKGMQNVELTQVDSLNYWFLWFENEHTPLDDVRVRKAMWQALDISTILTSLYGDTVSPMDSFCPSTAFGCPPAEGMPTYDPENAKKLLAEAGYPDGFSTDIIFSTATSDTNNLVQTLISAWDEVGVTVEPRGLDAASWLSEFTALNWDMDVQANQTITGDADYTLNRLYSCEAKRLGYCNEDLDELMMRAQQSTSQDERADLYQQVVDMMAEDAPAIPLFQVKANVAARSNVQGLKVPPTEFIDFSTVYLTQ